MTAWFSATRIIYDWRKNKLQGTAKTEFKRAWPAYLLLLEVGLAVFLACISCECEQHFFITFIVLRAIVFVFSGSRVSEICYAYYVDAMDKLRPDNKIGGDNKAYKDDSANKIAKIDEGDGIGPNMADRVTFTIKSYGSLLLNWAFICFSLPVDWWHIQEHPSTHRFLDSLYFSGVTITTIGYGDVTPVFWVSRLLAVCEALSGMLIIVIALATYLTKLNGPHNAEAKGQPADKGGASQQKLPPDLGS
jgi:hypothetical protein